MPPKAGGIFIYMARNYAIDNVRGLVMVIMALDHVRDFFHETALTASPTDLTTTTPALFWTRILTHICAPTFLFLSGVSAAYTKDKNKAFSRYILVRGWWLILLDFTLIAFGLFWDIRFQTLLFNVLAAIGTGFVLLSAVHRLSPKILFVLAFVITFGHPLLASLLPGLLSPTAISLGARTLVIAYPPLPWFGIMLFGYAVKPYLTTRTALYLGTVFLCAFTLLRFLRVYDAPWDTLLSYFNLTKYPPSPLFVLFTLGIALLLLVALGKREIPLLSLFGKVPLFYFVGHWYVMHALLFGYLATQGYGPDSWEGGQNLGRPATWAGLDLGGVYLAWVVTVASMYPLCRWYLQFRNKTS